METKIVWQLVANKVISPRKGKKYLICGHEILKGQIATFIDIAYFDSVGEWMLPESKQVLGWAELPILPI